MIEKPLTPKQQRFVEEFLIDFNGTQAAIRAGYSALSARQSATDNMMKASVQAAIAEVTLARTERTHIDQDWVVTKLAENLELAMGIRPAPDNYEGAVANKALELLGRHTGGFVERSEVDTRNVVVNFTVGKGYDDEKGE